MFFVFLGGIKLENLCIWVSFAKRVFREKSCRLWGFNMELKLQTLGASVGFGSLMLGQV